MKQLTTHLITLTLIFIVGSAFNSPTHVPEKNTNERMVAYCGISSEFPWHEWISNVTLGTLNNNSAKEGYGNFTNLPAPNLQQGSSSTLNLTTTYSYQSYSEHWKVWIDFNQNESFESNEVVYNSLMSPPASGAGATKTVSPSIAIPSNAQTGNTRMRVTMKRNTASASCDSNGNDAIDFGEAEDYIVNITQGSGGCPSSPTITNTNPSQTSATVTFNSVSGANSYNISWTGGSANNINSPYTINSLNTCTSYSVTVTANCTGGSNSANGSFTTTGCQGCLPNKNYIATSSQLQTLANTYNTPSSHTFSDMIAVNDGGSVFRSFQNETYNQITDLTTQYRSFHLMDEDFNDKNALSALMSAVPSPYGSQQIQPYYDQTTKPKDTNPEGTPAHTIYNKTLYQLYKTHGFSEVTGATEILFYPFSWKEKIYNENEWSSSGFSGIQNSFNNYTKKFIDEYAPAGGNSSSILVHNFQIGNENWDYPQEEDVHSMWQGARNAFVSKYGPRLNGGWKMNLVLGAYQSYKLDDCTSTQRNFSNCGFSLERHDFIGDYLDVNDCTLLDDLYAIDCHPYSFSGYNGSRNNTWTYPENVNSETNQLKDLVAWRDANNLQHLQLWSSEFGYDSETSNGVGEATQNAYLLRGLLLHSRYHYAKVYFYNAYDKTYPTSGAYSGFYQSSGFWKQALHPAGYPTPLISQGAAPKPSWHGMMDFKNRFGNHVFAKALNEGSNVNAYLLTRPDGTDPYVVFWNPTSTNDSNVENNQSVSVNINWSTALSGSWKIETTQGRIFSDNGNAGSTFTAASGTSCGNTTLTNVKRMPAFIKLVNCSTGCPNVTNAGSISPPNPSSGNNPFNPGNITNSQSASGGTGTLQYKWQQSINSGSSYTDISGATSSSYNPPSLTQTTLFRRGAKRSSCSTYLYTSPVTITINSGSCTPYSSSCSIGKVSIEGCSDEIKFTILSNDINYIKIQKYSPYQEWWVCDPYNNSGSTCSQNSSFNQSLAAGTYDVEIQFTNYSFCSIPSVVVGSSSPRISSIDNQFNDHSKSNKISTIEKEDIYLYPNPTQDILNIDLSKLPTPTQYLKIYNSTGMLQFIIENPTRQDKLEMNTSKLSAGIYFISFENEDTTPIVKSFVIQR